MGTRRQAGWIRFAICFVSVVALSAACGEDDSGPTSSSSTPPSTGPAPTATALPAPSVAELNAVVEQVFPAIPSGVAYGYCGPNQASREACPYSTRLKARLSTLTSANFCRCQNGSSTREYTVQPSPTGGRATVTQFGGSQVLELTIIREAGRLVVDDQVCAGRPATSIYNDPVGPC